MSRLHVAFLTLAAGLVTSSVAADVVTLPVAACLPGSRPVLAHHGPVCAVAECNNNADCEEGMRRLGPIGLDAGVCQQRRLCVRDIGYSGPSGGYGPADVTHTVVVGACDGSVCREERAPWENAGGYGDADAWRLIGEPRCEEQRVCAPNAPEPNPVTPAPQPESSEPRAEQSSGCNAGAGAGFGFVALVLLLVTRRR